MESIVKIDLPWKSFLMNFGIEFVVLFEASGPAFLVFWALKTDLKIEGFLVWKRILSSGSGGGDLPPILGF